MFESLLARAREARAGELEDESGRQGGFTLIELMVVLLIMAILLAIAIPTFLGVSGSARDRSSQSNASNALTDMISFYQTDQTFNPSPQSTACSQNPTGTGCPAGSQSLATNMDSVEPAFNWVLGASSANACSATNYGKCVSVNPVDVITSNDGQGVVLAVLSGNNNNCWFVANLQTGNSSNPVQAVATTGFETTTTSGSAGYETGATTAGTYYAELPAAISGGNDNCYAGYAQADSAGWVWYTSYSAAAAASTP